MGPNIILLLVLTALINTIHGVCVREFFAQPVIYDVAMDIDFYYTGINIASVKDCAEFCGDRHFCRTAVYNTNTKTCAISYEYTLNCRYSDRRFTSFDTSSSSSHLIQVACITKCNDPPANNEKRIARDPAHVVTGEPLPTVEPQVPTVPAVLKKVELITGEPNDGDVTGSRSDVTGSRSDVIGSRSDVIEYKALARSSPQKDSLTNGVSSGEEGYVNQIVISNISGRVLPLLDERRRTIGAQICYRQVPHKYLLGSAFERHNHLTVNECRCRCAATYTSGKLAKCQSFQWYTSGVCVLNKGNHRGKFDLIDDHQATYQFVDCDVQVLLDIAASVCVQGKTERLTSSQKRRGGKVTSSRPVTSSPKQRPVTSSKKIGEEGEKKTLGRASLPERKKEKLSEKVEGSGKALSTTKQPVTLTTILMTSSETPTTSEVPTTSELPRTSEVPTTSEISTSSEISATPEAVTTSEAPTTSGVPTTSEELLTKDEVTSENAGTENRESSTEAISEETRKAEPEANTTANTVTSTETSTASETTSSEVATPEATSPDSNTSETSAAPEVTSPESTRTEAKSTESLEVTSSTVPEVTEPESTSTGAEVTSPVETTREVTSSEVLTSEATTTTEIVSTTKLPIVHSGCFEMIGDHMMVSVAGGLEHDVTMEECQCFCANSKSSGRYSFQCASATYYHNERDCILNLEDRFEKKQYFERHFNDFNVTYIGMTCDRDSTIASIVNNQLVDGCRHAPKVVATNAPRTRAKGAHSDNCFVELPSFVLEGVAMQVEGGVSPQQCKCLCATAEQRLGEACQSFQYYYDSSTCLLSKQNRFSNPESFNFAPSSQPRSYFEYKCATKEEKQKKYLKNHCANDVIDHGLNKESTAQMVRSPSENDIETVTPIPSRTTQKIESTDRSKETNDVEEGSGEISMPVEKVMSSAEAMTSSSEVMSSTEEVTSSTTEYTESATMTTIIGEVTTPEYKDGDSEESEETETTTEAAKEETTTTAIPKRKWKKAMKKKSTINRAIPETEGLDDRDFEEQLEMELTAELDESDSEVPSTTAIPKQKPQADAIRTPPIEQFKKFARKVANKKIQGVKTRKFTDKERKAGPRVEMTSSSSETTRIYEEEETTTVTTSTFRTTTTAAYPTAGRCTYSALYQTSFYGRKMLKAVHVKNASDCFAACFALRCRSANLISQGSLNQCELFHDSLIDYRRPDMIGYDGATVYFDGIRCDGV